MDSTNPATAQQQEAASFDTLAMVTAAVANNTNLNMAAALLAAPNPHFLNALNSAFPLYSVAGTTSLLNAIVATNAAPLQPTVTPQQTATAGSSFITAQHQQHSEFNNLLSTAAASHCSCTGYNQNTGMMSQNHPNIPPSNVQEERPTPSNFLRSSRKRPLDSGIRSGSTRQPSSKYQRMSSSTQRRPDTPNPLISPDETPRIQANLADHYLDSVFNDTFVSEEHQLAAAQSAARIGFNSRNLATAFINPHPAISQEELHRQATSQSCPVCHTRQIQPSATQNPAIGIQQSALATSSQTNLLPSGAPATFILPPTNFQTHNTNSPQISNIDESSGNSGGCVCTGYHCARCSATDPRGEEIGAWFGRNASRNINSSGQINRPSNPTTQMPAELFALALNRVQQQFPQIQAPPVPSSQIHYPTFQQQLALLQTTGVPATISRAIPHQMTRASSLNGVSPFPATNHNQEHINLINRRQQTQNQSNDILNRFYSTNSVVLPSQAQSVQNAAIQQMETLQNNHIALRAARLAPAPTTANTVSPYHPVNHSSLLLLSGIHNIHHQLAATEMPMIFFPASTNEYVLGNPEAVTHAVATAMHHVPEPQPIGASSDQIKRCTQIRNYVKDAEVPEQERERCTVCLMDFETGEDIRTLNCSHMFHIDCIDRWLNYNKKCPVCRIDMDKLPLLITDNEEDTLSLTAQ